MQGAVFKKFFRGYGDFKGTIREYREEADVYYVTYEDGDKVNFFSKINLFFYFKGTIKEYREEADVYYVTYEDGDKAR